MLEHENIYEDDHYDVEEAKAELTDHFELFTIQDLQLLILDAKEVVQARLKEKRTA
jgi:hypothetical protein